MTKKPQTWTQRAIIAPAQWIGTNGLAKLGMTLIILIAYGATYLGALTTLNQLGFGVVLYGQVTAAHLIAVLPDALMVLSSGYQRKKGLTAYQRAGAHKSSRFGLGLSVIINMVAGFLIQAPNGYWISSASPRAVWMQHVIFILVIVAHAIPVSILWFATEMLTRPAQEPASLASKRHGLAALIAWTIGLTPRKILAQNAAQTAKAK